MNFVIEQLRRKIEEIDRPFILTNKVECAFSVLFCDVVTIICELSYRFIFLKSSWVQSNHKPILWKPGSSHRTQV